MNLSTGLSRILVIVGGLGMLLGAIDPLEGSVVILVGSGLVTLGIFLRKNNRLGLRYWLLTFLLVVFGVAAMFVISAFGGFGGGSDLSWWWGVLILPYPIGWLMGMVNLIARLIGYIRRRPAMT